MTWKGSAVAFAACGATNCVANLTWWLQPLLIAYWVQGGVLHESQAGFVISIEMGLLAISGIVFTRLLTRGRIVVWTLLAMAGAMIAAFASLFAHGFVQLATMRGLVGICVGLVMMSYYTIAGRSAEPDRLFAKMGIVNLLSGAMLVAAPPVLARMGHPITPLELMVGALVVLSVPAAMIPAHMHFEKAQPDAVHAGHVNQVDDPARTRRIWLLCAIALGLGTIGGVSWSFFGVIAGRANLSPDDINAAIGGAILFSMPASAMAAWLGTRIGRFWPQVIAVISMTCNVLLLTLSHAHWAFSLAPCLNLGGLYFALPFLFGAGSQQDEAGQGSAYVGSAFTLTGCVSPFIGGLVLQYLGAAALMPVAIALSIIVIGGLIWFEILSRPDDASTPDILARA